MFTVDFYKYHGTGNDFVVLHADASTWFEPAWVPAICDRHRGVGADGVLVVATTGDGVDGRMTVYNRDGSRPQMCGNGIRCVARFLVEVLDMDHHLRIETDAGVRECHVDSHVSPWRVSVDMGTAEVGETVEVAHDGRDLHLLPVDLGNPHAVAFDALDLESIDALGQILNRPHVAFPEGVNLEVTRVADVNHLDVVVYERGVGRTQACGTGACAAAAAAWRLGKADPGAPTRVDLPGGTLVIEKKDERVWMTGEVEGVFIGHLQESWIALRKQS